MKEEYVLINTGAAKRIMSGKNIVDKGTVVLRDENDQLLLKKYLEELKHDNENYRPDIFK